MKGRSGRFPAFNVPKYKEQIPVWLRSKPVSDLETFKELICGMADAKSAAELWIKQARFMQWCGDNPDKLAFLISAPLPSDKPEAEAVADRFFIEHGAIHDRVTGQHVGMDAEADWQPRLLVLLNELWVQKPKSLKLLFSNDWLRATVPNDTEAEPMAGGSLPSDKLRGLVRKWRRAAENGLPTFGHSAGTKLCADELEALLSQEPSSGATRHVWDRDGERCVNCGQKDWMAGSECRGKNDSI